MSGRELIKLPTFRDFVVLYIAEGYKRSRNTASVCNSDPDVVALAMLWLRRLSSRTPVVGVHYHLDQGRDELQTLGVDPATVRLYAKSTAVSCGAAYGAALTASRPSRCTTLLRNRLQGWIDQIHESWG